MSNNWSRREMLRSLSVGVIAGNQILAATATAEAASPLARCAVQNHRGEPLSVREFDRFHTCDLLMQPFTVKPLFEAGEVAFQPPERPFRIALPMTVPGFGEVFVYADNRGRGYTRQSFSEKPLLLNYEFAADRLATIRALWEECQHSGISISAAAHERAEKAKALFEQAGGLAQDRPNYVRVLMLSLCESLWAGEMMVTERAEQMIVRNGPRPGFLFGCNAEGPRQRDPQFVKRFAALFNFATLASFYREAVERVRGQPDFSGVVNLLEWLDHTKIITKGHPLIFLVPNATPDWQRNLSFEETRKSCLQHVRDSILKFRNRVHIWDVINEAHVQPDNAPGNEMGGFTKEQNVELTTAALKKAREADPTCFRIVNSTGTWCDYYMARQPAPWQQSVYDYLKMVKDAGNDYEAVGLQYYHSGRDMLEFERNLESFRGFGKPIHITELGFSSSSDNVKESEWWGGGVGGAKILWRGERFTEETQAQWFETFYKIAFSKSFVDAITCWDFTDPGFIPNGGLLRADFTPKDSYERLLALLTKWKQEEILPSVGAQTDSGV
jgi:endo-1,4-beta-xylanase